MGYRSEAELRDTLIFRMLGVKEVLDPEEGFKGLRAASEAGRLHAHGAQVRGKGYTHSVKRRMQCKARHGHDAPVAGAVTTSIDNEGYMHNDNDPPPPPTPQRLQTEPDSTALTRADRSATYAAFSSRTESGKRRVGLSASRNTAGSTGSAVRSGNLSMVLKTRTHTRSHKARVKRGPCSEQVLGIAA